MRSRAQASTINFGTADLGASHLGGEMMKRLAKVDIMRTIPGRAHDQSLLGRHVQMVFADPQPILRHIHRGKVRALAITSEALIRARSATFAEAGCRDSSPRTGGAYSLPATPKTIADKLNADLAKAMGSAASARNSRNRSTTVRHETLRDFVAPGRKWGKLVRKQGYALISQSELMPQICPIPLQRGSPD